MTIQDFYKHIRIVGLRHLIWPLFPIVASVIMMVMIPFEEMLNPIKVKSTEQAMDAIEMGHVYIELEIPELIYSGYNHMKDSDVYGEYYYDLVDNAHCIFYLLEPDDTEGYHKKIENVTTRIKVVETNGIFDNMLEMFSGVIDWTPEGVAGITKPYILSELEYSGTLYWAMFIMVLILFVYGLVLFVYNLIFVIAPWMSPKIIYAKIKHEGRLFKIDNFVNQVVTELEQPKVAVGNMYITEHFFVNMGKMEYCIIPIEDIKLVYEHSALKSFLGMHLNVTYTLHFKCSTLIRFHVNKKSLEEANGILDYFKENEPDILIGYTNENKVLVKEGIRGTKIFKR